MKLQFSRTSIALGVCALILSRWPYPSTARADDFEATQNAQIAQNPAGVKCELRFQDGRTKFQIGETIRATLSFSSETPGFRFNPFFQPPPSLLNLGDFQVSPSEGVVDPWAELPKPNFISIMGHVPKTVALSANPTEITVDLNQYLRFERPGTYRVSVQTERVYDDVPANRHEMVFPARGYNVTSNIATLEIIATDPEWARAQVEAQRAIWKQPRRHYDEIRDAPSFRYLQTRKAMDAIIEHLGEGERPGSSEDETYYYRLSLVGFLDRPYLIGAMERAIARPDYAVTQGLLETLTLLRALELKKRDPSALSDTEKAALNAQWDPFQSYSENPIYATQERILPADWNRAADALSAKTGRARAMTIHSLLELAWGNPLLEKSGRTRKLQAQVPAIYANLPAYPQEYLLDKREWPRIKSPAMRAPLVAVWNSLPPRENDYPYFADAVLTRLLELAPTQGRALALREMAAPRPRVSTKMLLQLPGGDLPQFDKIWLKALTTNGNGQENAALLIGRFASPAIETSVRRVYQERRREKMLSSDVSQGLQTYLKRVARRSIKK